MNTRAPDKMTKKTLYKHVICLSITGNLVLIYLLKNYLMPGTHLNTRIDRCDSQCIQRRAEDQRGYYGFDYPERQSTTPSSDVTSGNYTFLINPRGVCSWGSKVNATPKIAIMVISKVNNFVMRYAIRKTWGSFDRRLGSLAFLLGTTEDSVVQQQLNQEAEFYNDIIQVNVTDAYNLLTYKSIAMLEWFNRYCRTADFFLKSDDDTFLSVDSIHNATTSFHLDRFLFCYIHKNAMPIRDTASKWYVSKEEFHETVFPTYCAGPAYLFTSSLLHGMYMESLHARYCSMEDVFITGIVAHKMAPLTYIHSPKFVYMWPKDICTVKDAYSLHKVESQDMLTLYSYSIRNGSSCNYILV